MSEAILSETIDLIRVAASQMGTDELDFLQSTSDSETSILSNPDKLNWVADGIEQVVHPFLKREHWSDLPDSLRQELLEKSSLFLTSEKNFERFGTSLLSRLFNVLFRHDLYRAQRRLDRVLKATTELYFTAAQTTHADWIDAKQKNLAREKLRTIAYSMDLLVPGIYFWCGNFRVIIGGLKPNDEPYRYPGTIHSAFGFSLVLPGYHMISTYQGDYDPRQASN